MSQRTLTNPLSVSHLYPSDSHPNRLKYTSSTSSRPTQVSSNTYRSTLNSTTSFSTAPTKTRFKHPSCVNLFTNSDSPQPDHTVIDFVECNKDVKTQSTSLEEKTLNTLKNKISIASSIQHSKTVHKYSSSDTVINDVMDNINRTIFQDLVNFSNLNHLPPVPFPFPNRLSYESQLSSDSQLSADMMRSSLGFPRKASTLSFPLVKLKQLMPKPNFTNMERAVTSTTYKCDGSEASEFHNQLLSSANIIPPGSIFFVVGFIFFPCWWIGAIYPKVDPDSHTIDLIFKKLNFYMSLFSIPLLMLIIGCLIWYFVAN